MTDDDDYIDPLAYQDATISWLKAYQLSLLEVLDISNVYRTEFMPLARVMRRTSCLKEVRLATAAKIKPQDREPGSLTIPPIVTFLYVFIIWIPPTTDVNK